MVLLRELKRRYPKGVVTYNGERANDLVLMRDVGPGIWKDATGRVHFTTS